MMFTWLDKLGVRERMALFVATLCVMALLLDYLVVRPVIGKLDGLNLEIESETAQLAYNMRVLQWRDTILKQYEEVSGLVGTATSSAEEADALAAEVDAMARQTRVELPSMGSLTPRKTDVYEEYLVEVRDFEAGMAALLAFLYESVQRPGLLRVSKLTVTPDRAGDRLRGSMLITKVMLTEAK